VLKQLKLSFPCVCSCIVVLKHTQIMLQVHLSFTVGKVTGLHLVFLAEQLYKIQWAEEYLFYHKLKMK